MGKVWRDEVLTQVNELQGIVPAAARWQVWVGES